MGAGEAGEVDQIVRALAAKFDDLSWIQRTQERQERPNSGKLSIGQRESTLEHALRHIHR